MYLYVILNEVTTNRRPVREESRNTKGLRFFTAFKMIRKCYTMRGRGMGMMNFPPRALYSFKFVIISGAKFHARISA